MAGRERSSGRRQRGVALVEFALVLPVLATLCFGLVDLTRAYQLYGRLHSAAREGAAFAQNFPTEVDSGCQGTQNIVNKAIAEDSGLNLSSSDITVSWAAAGSSSWTSYSGCPSKSHVFVDGDRVRVQVQSAFMPLTPLITNLVGASKSLTGTAVAVVQQ
jgi:Flp pilus assembly protein TadG